MLNSRFPFCALVLAAGALLALLGGAARPAQALPLDIVQTITGGGLTSSGGVAVGPGGELRVLNDLAKEVLSFDASGAAISGESFGCCAGQDPTDAIDVDAAGNIVLLDSNSFRIERYSTTGSPLAAFNINFNMRDIVVDSSGNYLVTAASSSGHRIIRVNSTNGAITQTIGLGEFSSIAGIAEDALGNVYATDSSADTVRIYDSAGTFLRGLGAGNNPGAVAVDTDGNIYIATNFTQVIVLPNTGGFLGSRNLPGTNLRGLALGGGKLYVGTLGDRVEVLESFVAPEPTSLALLAVASVGLLLRRPRER